MALKLPERYRVKNPHPALRSDEGDRFGVFMIHDGTRGLKVIASDGEETGWEHVSVSLMKQPKKCPTWNEMCSVKSLFWEPSDVVVQFHPAQEDYVSYHDGCLHLWRYVREEFPCPPSILVGPKSKSVVM